MSLAATRRELLLRFRAMYRAEPSTLLVRSRRWVSPNHAVRRGSDAAAVLRRVQQRVVVRHHLRRQRAGDRVRRADAARSSSTSPTATTSCERCSTSTSATARSTASARTRAGRCSHPTQSVGSPGRARQRDVARRGYGLAASRRAARGVLTTPKGLHFTNHQATRTPSPASRRTSPRSPNGPDLYTTVNSPTPRRTIECRRGRRPRGPA